MILKVMVGSRAHGLADEHSDTDYRGVFVNPTSAILSLGGSTRQTSWIEKGDGAPADDTAWEIGHFLALALHCNPSILEVFAAPVEHATDEGRALRALFSRIWHPKGIRDAFVGYGLNQRKKMLENKDQRPSKYASTYLRVLVQAHVLLTTHDLIVDMRGHVEYERLRRWKGGMFTNGEVVDTCSEWTEKIEDAVGTCRQEPDHGTVNDFLLSVRRAHWQ